MATTPTTNRTEAASSLADIIRQNKKQRAETSSGVDVSDLRSLIEDLKKERAENSDYFKKISKFQQRYSDKITNPTTWKRMLVPSFTPFYKTMEKNWELDDKRRAAEKEIAKRERLEREKQTKELNARLDEFIKESSTLGLIAKKFGQNAARREALMNEEMKAIQKADADYMRNMDVISDKLSTINDDAKKEWAQRKGIQLVKIVEDEPSKEELAKIKNMLAEQLDKQGEQYEQQRIEAKTKATEDRRRQEALLKEQSWFRKMFKGDKSKSDEKKGGGIFDSIISWLGSTLGAGLGPLLVKAGLVAGILTFFKEYFQNPEFRQKVDQFLEGIKEQYIKPALLGMLEFLKNNWEIAVLALAAAFPLTTIRLIGTALGLLYAAIAAAVRKIGGIAGMPPPTGLPDTAPDGPDKGKGGDKGAPGKPEENRPKESRKERRKRERAEAKAARKAGKLPGAGGTGSTPGAGTPKPPGAGGIAGKLGVVGALLTIAGIDALLDYDDDRVWAAQTELEESPFYDMMTDEEEAQYLTFVKDKEFNKAHDYLNDVLGPKYGYKREKFLGMRLKDWKPLTSEDKKSGSSSVNSPPRAGAPSSGASAMNLSNPLNDPFIASRVGMGPNPMMLNAPSSTTNNNSSTTIIPFRTVPDPSRSIMFQNKS